MRLFGWYIHMYSLNPFNSGLSSLPEQLDYFWQKR